MYRNVLYVLTLNFYTNLYTADIFEEIPIGITCRSETVSGLVAEPEQVPGPVWI